MFQQQAESKNQTLCMTEHILYPYVYVDEPHLSEVCINIIRNAVKYTNAGGTISCKVEQRPCENEDWCDMIIRITDNAIGMTEEFQKHIFEAFERERTSTITHIEGIGIGMGIVKKLVDLMGGTIEVESKLGEGSTFTVTIPCKKASKEEALEEIKKNLKKLPYEGVDYRLETTGKGTQFGNLQELVDICKEVPSCKLCIDFSHIHARGIGALKEYKDFAEILEYIKDNLGNEALEDLHIHMSGIHYTDKGERNHLPFLESDFNFIECLRALKDYKVKGCIICESPLLEKDALLLKETYEKL